MRTAPSIQEEILEQQDKLLKSLAEESVKQGENLRNAVRDITLQGLQMRELSLAQIKRVIRSVTEGVNLGVAGKEVDAEKSLQEVLTGMDKALLKTVQASRLALEHLTGAGQEFEDSPLKQALNDLEQLENSFLTAIQEVLDSAAEEIRRQWASILDNAKLSGTETGGQVAMVLKALRDFQAQVQQSFRESRRASLRAAYLLTQNFATLASGVLIGLSEALQPRETAAKLEVSEIMPGHGEAIPVAPEKSEDVPSREGRHEESAKVEHSYSISWLEAGSTSAGERPVVLFHISTINYVEIRPRLAGNEHCRVVFTNGSEYVLHDAERAGNFLRQLREQGACRE
jgi:ElaB/YqjD/DUF883 family membrane-anchored ribosome-binding protein